MQFVATQMAQVIQSVSQGRTDKKITLIDLVNAGKLAYLTIFPGNTLIPTKSYYYPFGYHVCYSIFYVKGTDNGKASVIWAIAFAGDGRTYQSNNSGGMWYSKSQSNFGELNRMSTKFVTNSDMTKIHPKLTIESGETKIIVECALLYSTKRYYADNTPCSKKLFREVFGFLLISPKRISEREFSSFFNSVVIFTPKPGLFDETPPS